MLMPVLLIVALLPMSYGLWWHGKQSADAAAEHAAAAAALAGANPQVDGREAAETFLAGTGNLTNVTVTITETGDTIVVDVTGDLSFSILSRLSVSSRAEETVETFTSAVDR